MWNICTAMAVLFKCLAIFMVLLGYTKGQVLQCPSCAYFNTEADVPGAVRTVIDGVLHFFQEPKCGTRLTGPIPEIKMETCAPPDGKIAMCNYYDGKTDVKIDILVTSFNVPLRVYTQGCYYALSANPPSVGCHDRQNINEDKSTMKRILDEATSLIDDVVSTEGKMCFCKDSYCDDVSGEERLTPKFVLLLISLATSLLMMRS